MLVEDARKRLNELRDTLHDMDTWCQNCGTELYRWTCGESSCHRCLTDWVDSEEVVDMREEAARLEAVLAAGL